MLKICTGKSMENQIQPESMLWEERVLLMRQGLHRKLVKLAYETPSSHKKVFPDRENVFSAMRQTSLKATRVVIIGQDPYFNEHPGKGPEAHGLCFSVKSGIPIPPSLRNILQEVNACVYEGKSLSVESDLSRWAVQGVLLLNASLTVLAGEPNSHAGLGWHQLTDDIIATISKEKNNIVFMLWGAFAQKKTALIDQGKHLVLATSHPSPLSAHKGFLGSGVFLRCNQYLIENSLPPITW